MNRLRRLSRLVKYAMDLVLRHAQVDARGVRVGTGRQPILEPTPKSLAAYKSVLAQKVALIDRLPSKYRTEAEEIVWRAVIQGYDAAALARELRDRFGILPERARLVARTQCNMARAVVENARRLELGQIEAVWVCNKKEPAEPAHLPLDGRRYLLTTGVTLNDKAIWPGSEPGCLCTSVALSEDDEDNE